MYGCRSLTQDCGTICDCNSTNSQPAGEYELADSVDRLPENWKQVRCTSQVYNGYINPEFQNSTIKSQIGQENTDGQKGQGHDYYQALALSTIFMDSQRSGRLTDKAELKILRISSIPGKFKSQNIFFQNPPNGTSYFLTLGKGTITLALARTFTAKRWV